jgi:dTDP-glucose pyrophosphorylase
VQPIAELAEYIASPQLSVREVLERLNRLAKPFQVVLDRDNRLLGTVTDGDLRRGILRGVTLEAPISSCMHATPLIGKAGDDRRNAELLKLVAFLPLVDGEGHLIGVIAPSAGSPLVKTALIMAGGLGTRLGKRTMSLPKPLLPVGGRPILEHILTVLERIGVGRIWIAVHHLSHLIEEFVNARPSAAEVRLLHERERLGTAGALGILPESPSGPLLVLNGDVLTQVDFVALDAFHRRHGYDATIAVAHHEVQVPYGVVRHDDGLFLGVEEKPVLRNFVAAGIYYLSPEMLALVPPQARMEMPELLNEARRVGLRIGLFPIHEYWADVGRPEDLDAADAYHREAK